MNTGTFTRTLWSSLVLTLLLGANVLAQAPQPSLPANPDLMPPPPPDPTPDTIEAAWKWDLGELTAGLKYNTTLTIQNDCPGTEGVKVETKNLPEVMLDLPGCLLAWPDKSCNVTVPGKSSLDVATIIESDKWWYYVDPMAPFATPRPFKRISGEVIVTHARNDICLERIDTYAVSFMVWAMKGELPPPKRGPEKIAGAGFCEVWWNTGVRPTMLKPDVDCTSIIRPLAAGYRERILAPYIEQNPSAWAWLPTVEQIASMSGEEMVAMKVRAAAQIAP